MLRLLVISLFAAALLAPAMFRRQRRRAGLKAGELTPVFRKRLLVMTLVSSMLLVGALTGVAVADNGDPTGAKTGISPTQVESVYPVSYTHLRAHET
jgi:hypothetical protein